MQLSVQNTQSCRCFYYSFGIPVSLRKGPELLFRMPEKIETAAEITGDAALSAYPVPEPSQESTAYSERSDVRYYATPAEEHYIEIQTGSGLTVSVGPFLTEPVTPVFINRLIHSGAVKIKNRTDVQEYLSSLPVLSSQRFYYLGLLLGMLFRADASRKPEEMPAAFDAAEQASAVPSDTDFPDSYFIQSKEYKSQLFFHSPYMTEQEICHFISKGDAEGALRVLSEINTRPRARLAGTVIRSVKNSMICSCTFMARAAIDGGVSPDEAFTLSDAYIQGIEACNDISRILNYEYKMVKGYTAAVNAASSRGHSAVISRAVDYINSHLCEELSVTRIAENVFLNPNYLSGLFLKETGESLHGFILRRRIEEAAYFVKNTFESFAEIASLYRFCSQSHFTKCFKSVMGTTPGKYRHGEQPLQ